MELRVQDRITGITAVTFTIFSITTLNLFLAYCTGEFDYDCGFRIFLNVRLVYTIKVSVITVGILHG